MHKRKETSIFDIQSELFHLYNVAREMLGRGCFQVVEREQNGCACACHWRSSVGLQILEGSLPAATRFHRYGRYFLVSAPATRDTRIEVNAIVQRGL